MRRGGRLGEEVFSLCANLILLDQSHGGTSTRDIGTTRVRPGCPSVPAKFPPSGVLIVSSPGHGGTTLA